MTWTCEVRAETSYTVAPTAVGFVCYLHDYVSEKQHKDLYRCHKTASSSSLCKAIELLLVHQRSLPSSFVDAAINQAVFTQGMQAASMAVWQSAPVCMYLKGLHTTLVCSTPDHTCNVVRASVHACSYSSKASSWPQRASGFLATGQPWFQRHTAGSSINSSPSLTDGSVSSEYTTSVCILPQSSSICIVTCHPTRCQTVDRQPRVYALHSTCDAGQGATGIRLQALVNVSRHRVLVVRYRKDALLTNHLCLIVVGQSPL